MGKHRDQQKRWNKKLREGNYKQTGFSEDGSRNILFSCKSRLLVSLLAFFGGVWGLDRFYTGSYVLGFLKLMTLGGVFIWSFIDLLLAISGQMKDANGRYIKYWETY
jgi:TM2 domain-containing membrane protein YozV